jgi:hypothetical protein
MCVNDMTHRLPALELVQGLLLHRGGGVHVHVAQLHLQLAGQGRAGRECGRQKQTAIEMETNIDTN